MKSQSLKKISILVLVGFAFLFCASACYCADYSLAPHKDCHCDNKQTVGKFEPLLIDVVLANNFQKFHDHVFTTGFPMMQKLSVRFHPVDWSPKLWSSWFILSSSILIHAPPASV
jgi:hypothetical protein